MDFLEAIKAIESSRGYKIDSKAYRLENSFIMMVINFGELEKFLKFVPIFNVEQKRNGDSRNFLIEAVRRFSNYLTSATAFVSHTRRFINGIYGSGQDAFDGKYQEKVDVDFKDDSLAQFIEDLRNYYLHYELLPVSIVSRDRGGSFYSRITMSKKILLESGDIWKKGRSFLEGGSDEIDVLSLASDYMNKTLFPWIMQQQAKYHSEEFKELEKLKKIAQNYLTDKAGNSK